MYNGECLSIDEVLSHVGGSIITGTGPVGVTLVAPVFDLLCYCNCLLISQIGGYLIVVDNLHTVVLVEGLKIPLIPTRNDGTVYSGGTVCVLLGCLVKECIHIAPLLRNRDSHLICHILVVEHDLSGDQEWKGNNLVVILTCLDHTITKVCNIIIARLNVWGQILGQSACSVLCDVGGICNGDCRKIRSCCVCGNQSLIYLAVTSDVLCLYGDQILRIVEIINNLLHGI